jgi:hypothetical protein
MARGLLTRPFVAQSTARSASDSYTPKLYGAAHDAGILTALEKAANDLGRPRIWGPNRTGPPVALIRAYLDRLFAIEGRMQGKDGIHAAVRTREATSVAVRHRRDLYQLGGIFVTRDRVAVQIRRAFEDLKLALAVAEVTIGAEAVFAPAAVKPAPSAAGPGSPRASA